MNTGHGGQTNKYNPHSVAVGLVVAALVIWLNGFVIGYLAGQTGDVQAEGSQPVQPARPLASVTLIVPPTVPTGGPCAVYATWTPGPEPAPDTPTPYPSMTIWHWEWTSTPEATGTPTPEPTETPTPAPSPTTKPYPVPDHNPKRDPRDSWWPDWLW